MPKLHALAQRPFASIAKDVRFATGIARGKPFSALVQVTNRCNMQCSFCDFWPNAAPKRDELTADDYVRVSDELAKLGCFCVSIEGGEPFARPDLVDVVRAFARHHLPVLFTNGWYVTRDAALALWDAGLSQASVSIDYPDAARHDAKRGIAGTFARAWRAVELFRDTAPARGRQVNVMSVLMGDNHASFAEMLGQSRDADVGHQVTLISVSGFRRGKGPDRPPPPEAADELGRLFSAFPHVRFFGSYFDGMRDFLTGDTRALPTCTAGVQSLNIDHVGNVSACIERIGEPVGNVKTESVTTLFARLARTREVVSGCQDCWTACRGFQQALGDGASVGAFRDLVTRMRAS